jgi:hypothetical protein
MDRVGENKNSQEKMPPINFNFNKKNNPYNKENLGKKFIDN